MPEGLMTSGGTITSGVHDDPDSQPAPTADAPRGWTWDRKGRRWAPRQRGPVLFQADAGSSGSGKVADSGQAETGQQRDPDPAWLRDDKPDDKPPGDGKLKFEDVPAGVKGDIAGLLGLVGTPILALFKSVDPYCGGALMASFEPVVDACLPLICRSEKIVKYFSEDQADWLLWGKLCLALAPVGRAIVEHHVTRTVQVVRDEKTGQVHVVRVQPGQPQGDPLTPPQHAYAA